MTGLGVFFTCLFGTPAIGCLFLPRPEKEFARRFRKGAVVLSVTVTSSILLLLLLLPISWKVATAMWVAYLLVVSAILGVVAHLWSIDSKNTSKERDIKRSLWLLIFSVPFALSIPVFCQVFTALFFNGLPEGLGEAVKDPEDFFAVIVLYFFILLFLMPVFIILSVWIGRLMDTRDIFLCYSSWILTVFLTFFFIQGLLGSFMRNILSVELSNDLTGGRLAMSFLFFIPAMLPMTFYTAWGKGGFLVRIAKTVMVYCCAFLSLIILLGLMPWAECGYGRHLEKTGHPERALAIYGRSLSRRSTPLLISYLEHRVGLINYKLGREDAAINAFKKLQTTDDANKDLVYSSELYLERLLSDATGKRVVLPGVDTATDYRGAYCAPNTLAVVLKYMHKDVTASQIGQAIAMVYEGSSIIDMAMYCDKLNLDQIQTPFADSDDIRFTIDHGYPFIVYIPGHVLAVFGYDTRLKTFIAYDTATWDIWVDHTENSFLTKWSLDDYQGAVILPRRHSKNIDLIRARYVNSESRAAWLTDLATSNHWYHDKKINLMKALKAYPDYLPAAMSLYTLFPGDAVVVLSSSNRQLIDSAKKLIQRPSFAHWSLIEDLINYFLKVKEYKYVLEMYESLDAVGRGADYRLFAGRAYYYLGDPGKAIELLSDKTDDDAEGTMVLAEAREAKGSRKEAVTGYRKVLDLAYDQKKLDKRDVVARRAYERLENITGTGPDPARIWELSRYLYFRPSDSGRQLQYAKCLVASVLKNGKHRHKYLLKARRAATLAMLISSDEPIRNQSREIIKQVNELLKH